MGCLAFSPDGTRIASVGLDLDHSFCAWNWRTRTPVCVGKCGPCSVIAVRFSPDGTEVATAGVRHLKFWDVRGAGAITPKKADLGQKATLQTWASVAYLESPGQQPPTGERPKQDFVCMAGGEDGNVYVFLYGTCRSTALDPEPQA